MANSVSADVGRVSTDIIQNESASEEKESKWEKGVAWLKNALKDTSESLDSVYDISVKYNNIRDVWSENDDEASSSSILNTGSERSFRDYVPYIGTGVGIALLLTKIF